MVTPPTSQPPQTQAQTPASPPPLNEIPASGGDWRPAGGAASVLVLFYLYCLLFLTIVPLLLALRSALALTGHMSGRPVQALDEIQKRLRLRARFIWRGLQLKRAAQYGLELQPADAPGLFGMAADISRRALVEPPAEIVLENGLTASVRLRGYRQGKGHTRLTLGIDLLATLSTDEVEAVVAHEMAHARLIQRGFHGWLSRGAARMSQVAMGLAQIDDPSASRTDQMLPLDRQLHQATHHLATVPIRLNKLGHRLLAAAVRQDEFAADLMAARICGTAPFSEALTQLHVLDLVETHASLRDRRARLESGEPFLPWLRNRLLPRDAEQARKLRDQALVQHASHEMDTHPSLAERLAALQAAGPATVASPATPDAAAGHAADAFLVAPDAVVGRLIARTETVAADEQSLHSADLQRKLRTEQRGTPYPLWKRLAWGYFYLHCFVSFLGLLLTVFAPSGPTPTAGSWMRTALNWGFIAAVWIMKIRAKPDQFDRPDPLPIPSIEHWSDSLKRRAAVDNKHLTAELRQSTAAGSKEARTKQLLGIAREALTHCDYARAGAAARLVMELESFNMQAFMVYSVCAAYVGNGQVVEQAVGGPIKAFGIGSGYSWTMAWAKCLLRDWAAAEPYLLDTAAHFPAQPTLHYLLAISQYNTGKIQEAVNNLNKALQWQPESVPLHLLAMNLRLASGEIARARKHLEFLDLHIPTDLEVIQGWTQLHVLSGDSAEAARHAARLEEAHPGGANYVRLGWKLMDTEEADSRQSARRYFGMALQDGYYPEAMLGLARLEQLAANFEGARRLALSAADLTRERDEEAEHPINLLGAICQTAAALDEPLPSCQVWPAKLALPTDLDAPDQLLLLVTHQSHDEAKTLARNLYTALVPGSALPDDALQWGDAQAELAPAAPVRPGIAVIVPSNT